MVLEHGHRRTHTLIYQFGVGAPAHRMRICAVLNEHGFVIKRKTYWPKCGPELYVCVCVCMCLIWFGWFRPSFAGIVTRAHSMCVTKHEKGICNFVSQRQSHDQQTVTATTMTTQMNPFVIRMLAYCIQYWNYDSGVLSHPYSPFAPNAVVVVVVPLPLNLHSDSFRMDFSPFSIWRWQRAK